VKTGSVGVYLGNQRSVDHAKLTVDLNQTEYVQELLERFNMKNCLPVSSTPMVQRLSMQNSGEKLSADDQVLYRNMVGSLLYLACWTCPDISSAVSELSRFVSAPGRPHMQAIKHLLRLRVRYLKGTSELGLQYSKPKNSGMADRLNVLWGFVDSDWAGCPDTRRSTSGYALVLNGAAVSRKSKRQPVVALSTAEAEFIAASSMVQEVIYACRLLERLGFPQAGPTSIFEDNTTCIKWAGGAVGGTDRAKHIDLREHFVHEAQSNKILQLGPVNSACGGSPHQAVAQGGILTFEEAHHGILNLALVLTLTRSRRGSLEVCCKVTAEAPRRDACRVHVLFQREAGLPYGPPATRIMMKRH
jgi:hypothetical protein